MQPDSKTNSLLAPYEDWPVAQSKGKLVKVQVRPGQFVQIYEEEARKRGLLPPEEKMEDPKPNKLRRRPKTKKAEG